MTDVQEHLHRLAKTPGDPAALAEVEAAYRAEGRFEELLRVFEDSAQRLEKDAAATWLRKAAQLCMAELASPPRAETYLKRALEAAPADVAALRSLREITLGRGDWDRGAELYEKELARTQDPAQKLTGLIDLAEVYRDRLSRLDKAMTVLKQALKVDKSCAPAHRMLAEIYEAQDRLPEAQAAMLKELEASGSNPEVLSRLTQLGTRLLERPRQHELAKALCDAVLAADGKHTGAAALAQTLAEQAAQWQARVSDLQLRAGQVSQTDPAQAAELSLTIAELLLVYGQQPDLALSSLDRALAAKPGHAGALRLMEDIYGERDRYGELAMKLEMMAAYAREPGVAVDLYLKAAMHQAVRLDNPDAAARLYVRVLELDPGNKVASNALVEYYRERKLWDHALQVLQMWADRTTDVTDKVAANYAMCRIIDEELGDKQRARPYYEALLALDPQNQAAARALEQVYRQAGDHQKLAPVLAAKLAGLKGAPRLAVLKELGELYAGPLARPKEALVALGELYQQDPQAGLRERLEELAAQAGDFSALMSFLEGGLDKIKSDDDRVQALHSLAALYEGVRDAPLEALRIHRRILALRADDDRAKAAVARLLEIAAQTGDKVAFFREQADAAATPGEKVAILLKLTKELVDGTKDYVRAIDVFREILRLAPEGSPEQGQASDGLIALFRRDNRHAELYEVLGKRRDKLAAAERLSAEIELAGIAESHLAQPDAAVDHYLAALGLDGKNSVVHGCLERLLPRSKKVRAIAEALSTAYGQAGDWAKVVAMLEFRIKEEADAKARLDLLRQLAKVLEEKLQKPKEALVAALRAFQADPAAGDLRRDLERLAQAASEFSGVVRAYRSAALVLEGDTRVAILMRAAQLAEQSNDAAGATLDYLRLLGQTKEADGAALDGLRRLVQGGADPSRVVEASAQVIDGLDEAQRLPVLKLLGRFFDKDLGRVSDSIGMWKAVLQQDSKDTEASAELDRLFQTVSDPQELSQHLRQKLATTGDDAGRAQVALQLAVLHADKMNDVPGAVAALVEATGLAPGQKSLWRRLAELQVRAGDPAQAAQAMHRELNLLPEGEERQNRLVEYAELIGIKLGDLDNALLALQSVNAAKPGHPGAVALLKQMLGTTRDGAAWLKVATMLADGLRHGQAWQDLVGLLGAMVDQASDNAVRVTLLREVSTVTAEKLNNPAAALAAMERAFSMAPTDEPTRIELERIAERSNAWEQVAQAYQKALEAIPDATAQIPIRRKLAEILERRLGRAAEAVEHYKALSGGALPDDLPSLDAMERLLRSQNRVPELAEVLTSIALKLPDAEPRKKTLLAELGQICVQQLADKGRAVDVYKQLVGLDPKNLDALRRLDGLYGELSQPEAQAEVLQKLVDLGTANPQNVDDTVRRGNLLLQLGKPEDALAAYKAALMKKRDHVEALTGLEQVIDRVQNKLDVAQVLEPLYTAKQDHGKLAWVLERRLEGTTDSVQRKGLLRRIGDIYENRLQQKDRAFAMARRSMGEDPNDMGVRMWIEKLAGETGALRELADAYVEEAVKAAAPLNLQFHRRAAALYHEKLNDTAMAVQEYRAILGLEERDEKALSGLEAIFRSTEDSGSLVGILQKRLGQTAGIERKRELLTEIAQLQAEKLGELQNAVTSYREILKITPEDVGTLGHIETLLGQASQWEELVSTYEGEEQRLRDKVGRENTVRRLELSYRRARVIAEQFGDWPKASEILGQVLGEDAAHANTITYLDQNARGGIPDAMALLETNYKGRGEWQKYVEILQVKLQQTAESDLRRATYLELAAIFDDKLRVGDMAFMALGRAYHENRADLDLLDRLQALTEKYNFWQELVQTIGVDLDAIADPALRQDLLRRLGDICGQRLNDSQRAVAYLQAALQYDPRDKVALAALDALLEKNEMWAALTDVIERRVEVATEPGEKSSLLERLASVWSDRLMDAEAALRCHKQILEIDPDHPISLKSMQKLYAEVQDWDSLAKNLARQAEVLTQKEDQTRIHLAAGRLYAEELSDMDKAIYHYDQVAQLDPANTESNESLDVLLYAEERWQPLADHLRRQLAHTNDAAKKLDINRRLGTILGEKLGQGDDALTSWEEVLKNDAKNVEAMRSLLGLYTERAKWEPFVAICRKMIPLVDPAEAKDVRFLLAKALGESLGQRDEAIKLAREVRATEPHTADQMVRLGQMLRNIESWDEAATTIMKAASLETDPMVAVGRYYEAADIYRDKLGKPNDADDAYVAILAAAPGDAKAFAALAEIYRNTEEWRKLVSLNEEFVPNASPELRLAVLIEIRDVQEQRLGEKELAFIAACRVYKENPADLAAAEVLERIALLTEAAEEACAVLEDELDNIVDTAAKIAVYRRLARLYAENIKDFSSAEDKLRKILAIEPADMQALDALSALAGMEERPDKQIQSLEEKLTHLDDDASKKALLFDIARLWEDAIGDVDQAITALNRVLEIDGADKVALDQLARVFHKEGRYPELAHVLTRKVELSQDVAENIDLRMQVAQLCEGELRDAEAAIQWYRGVLSFDQGHDGALGALDRLYTGLERWSELVQVFELQLAKAASSEEQISLLSKEAAIYENQFQSAKDAVACYERVFAIDSTHLPSLRNFERLLRQCHEWNRLIEILNHHITLIQDPNEVTGLYLQIGDILYKELSRVDKAEQIYNKARELNPNSFEALAALGQLYERSGNWFQSLEMLQREADAKGTDPGALPILMRVGRINEDMLMDLGAAQTAYRRALEIDPHYGPALSAMKEIAKNAQNWEEYGQYLIAEAETSDDPEDQTELFMEVAKFFQDVREDEMSAIRYYQRALEITAGFLPAARQLADIYFRNEMWEESGEMYRIVIAGIDKAKEPKDFCQKAYRLGYVSEKVGLKDDALKYYKQAFEADATFLPALEGLGQALLATEAWEDAQKVFQTILIHHRDSLTESEVVDVQWQLGEICLKQNQPDKAYVQFEKAVQIDPDHAPSLSALAKLDQAMNRWEQAYGRLSRLGNVAPGPERMQALANMSQIALNQLKDIGRALEPLERGRKSGQATSDMLEMLADLYLQAHQAPKAVEVLEEATRNAQDPMRISELAFKLGGVYEKEIKHEPLAVQKYNAALDAAPVNVKAFEAIERILGARQEWALLEENYRAMIARAKDLSTQIRLVLWRNLGELYRQVLHNVDAAIMAYEVIQKMDPGKAQDTGILADLYALKPDKRAEAIRVSHELLGKTDSPVGPIRSLRKLYHAGQDFDAVFVMAMALAFLNEADQEEKQILEYLARGIPAKASRGLLEDHWKLLKHPDLDNVVGRLSALLYRSAPDFVTKPSKDLNLKKKDFIDVRSSDLYFATMINYAGKVLGLQGVDLYRKGGSMEPLHLANSQPPALVAGENNDIFREGQQRVVLFHVGRNLAYARPELFLARVFAGEELRDLLFGLCLVYNRSLQHNGHPTHVEQWCKHFEGLQPPVLKRLQPVAVEAYQGLVQQTPLLAYATAVEHTAARAGLLVAGDLASAMRALTEGGDGAVQLDVRQRVKELVMYSASLSYLQLRKLIGAALVAGQQGQQGQVAS